MKKLLLLAVLVSISFVWAQEPWVDAENDEHTSDASATEIISSEPIIVATIAGSDDPAVQETSEATPDMDMTASVEASISEYMKMMNIPVWYRWKDYSFNATVPFYISKDIPTFSETLSTSGIGDISIGAAYGKYFDMYNLYTDFNLSVKLPTGDEENTEKDEFGSEWPIPLGSGTTDFSIAASGFYFMNSFTFKSTLLYKMNGTYEDQSNREQNVGDLLIVSTGADFRWDYNLTFSLGMLYGNRMANETEGTSNKNGIQYIDLMPAIKYPISLFEFVLGAKIPVSTTLEDDSFNDGKRSTTINFRTNYRIF